MNELVREIEEDIREEKRKDFWQRFGKSAVWISVSIVAGTAAGVLWRDYNHSQAMVQTNLLISGTQQLQEGKPKEAIKIFDQLIESKSANHVSIAMLGKASAQERAGDDNAADQTWAELASKQDNSNVFSDIAKLRMTDTKRDISQDAVLRYSLLESKAWVLLEDNKKEEAAEIFANLYHDAQLAESMRSRVMLALQTIDPERLAPSKLETVASSHE